MGSLGENMEGHSHNQIRAKPRFNTVKHQALGVWFSLQSSRLKGTCIPSPSLPSGLHIACLLVLGLLYSPDAVILDGLPMVLAFSQYIGSAATGLNFHEYPGLSSGTLLIPREAKLQLLSWTPFNPESYYN